MITRPGSQSGDGRPRALRGAPRARHQDALHYPEPAVARRCVAPALPEIRVAEVVVEARMVRQQVVRRAAAVQSDAAVGSPGPRHRVDLVAAVEQKEAAHLVRVAAAPVAAVVAPAVAAAPHVAAAGAAALDVLVVAPVPAVGAAAAPVAAAAALDAVATVVRSAAFSLSPFPDLLEALGLSRAHHGMVSRVPIRAPQAIRWRRPTATLLF